MFKTLFEIVTQSVFTCEVVNYNNTFLLQINDNIIIVIIIMENDFQTKTSRSLRRIYLLKIIIIITQSLKK